MTSGPAALLDWRTLGGSAGLALGGAPLGNLYAAVDEAAAEATLERAWDLGVRSFDTAPHYGQGLSESRFGRFLRGRPREEFVLSTKVGRLLLADDDAAAAQERHGYVQALPYASVFDYSADGALRSIEHSLQRLQLDRIDIAYIHDIDRHTHGAAQPQRLREALRGALPALARLREQGVLRAIGIGVNEWQVCLDVMAEAPVDCLMLAGRHTLLDQSAAGHLLPECSARGVHVIAAGAYNSGILASGAVPGACYDYAPAAPEVLQRTRRIESVCREFGVPLRAAALQFARRPACVATVVVGARSAGEIADSVTMARHPVPPALWQRLADEGLLAIANV